MLTVTLFAGAELTGVEALGVVGVAAYEFPPLQPLIMNPASIGTNTAVNRGKTMRAISNASSHLLCESSKWQAACQPARAITIVPADVPALHEAPAASRHVSRLRRR
jgi:hypothetical protein